MLRARKVTCEQCGASIRLGAPGRFVVCRYCGSTLEMIRKVPGPELPRPKPAQDVPPGVDELALMRLENELARLDADWERKRQSLMVRDDQGNSFEPDDPRAVLWPVLPIVLGFLIPSFSGLSISSSGMGLAVSAVGVAFMIHTRRRSGEFERMRRQYASERMRIVVKISRLREGSATLRSRLRETLFGRRNQVIRPSGVPPPRDEGK